MISLPKARIDKGSRLVCLIDLILSHINRDLVVCINCDLPKFIVGDGTDGGFEYDMAAPHPLPAVLLASLRELYRSNSYK
jgi:hypothetical protein